MPAPASSASRLLTDNTRCTDPPSSLHLHDDAKEPPGTIMFWPETSIASETTLLHRVTIPTKATNEKKREDEESESGQRAPIFM